MLPEIHVQSPMSDAERRERLYDGAIFIYHPTELSRRFCGFADSLIRDAFGSLDPERAQYDLSVERYIDILKALKPKFIHHPKAKSFIASILAERGCDANETYYDVPRMRSSTSDGYLTTGIAYAWHPHRDTWYSAPQNQINWWTPIYPMSAGNGMIFFPNHFDKVVPNNSAIYDYAEWNIKHRFTAANHTKQDSRPLPKPVPDFEDNSGITIICEVGALIVFSGGQLHASVTNTSGKTRFSIDFRTINFVDSRAHQGAPRSDVKCTGTSIRDFKRLHDRQDFPEELAAELD